ncbi:MAG: hypothetical protein ACJ72O_07385 [Marmoricola sp.]
MVDEPESFGAWQARTSPRRSAGWIFWRIVAAVVVPLTTVLLVLDRLWWAIVVVVVAAVAIWVSERVQRP